MFSFFGRPDSIVYTAFCAFASLVRLPLSYPIMLRLFITNLDTGRVVVDNIEDIDKTEENGDEETHPPSNYL